MHKPKYALFFDNHTMAGVPDVGSEFNAEEFSDQIKACGVDYVGFTAKCNQGFCYYPTKTGIIHPSLKTDMFGSFVNACKKKNITVAAYFNCGLSNEDALRHLDWCTISPKGEILHPGVFELGWVTPYLRTMCLNSPYRDYLITLIKEVAGLYPIGGFLLDSFNGFPCICPECIRLMKKQGIDFRNNDAVAQFARDSAFQLAKLIKKSIDEISKDYLIYFLGISYEDNAIGSYLECECLPTYPCWGYDYLPIMAHHLRTLAGDDRPILNMTARFYEWGDFGSLRPKAGIAYDVYYGLANGMRPNIGGHIHPRGSTQPAIFNRIKEVYQEVQQYEEWYAGAKNAADIGVISSQKISKTPALIGTVRMLSELKQQFDIINTSSDFDKYACLILPDDVLLTPHIAEKIKKYIASGKPVLATGNSGLDSEKTHFLLEKEWGVTFAGPCPFEPSFFKPAAKISDDLPEIPLALYTRGLHVKALAETEIAGYLIKPYFNREFDGVYSNYYLPPDKITDLPSVVFSGKVCYITHPVFSAYHSLASVDLRTLVKNCLSVLLPDPLIRVKGLPSFGKVFVTRQQSRTMLHFLNYVPELRGKSEIVEEPLVTGNITAQLRLDGKKPARIYAAPERRDLSYKVKDNYAGITVGTMCGYGMAVVEWEE